MWHPCGMTPDEARAELRRIAADRDRIAHEEPAAIIAALEAGVRQTDVAKDIGRTREHIRRLAIAHRDAAHDASSEPPDTPS